MLTYIYIYIRIQKNGTDELVYRAEQRCRCREWTCGYSGGRRDWNKLKSSGTIYTIMCKIDRWQETALAEAPFSALY